MNTNVKKNTITMVICNSGDGSNHIQWITDPVILEKMKKLADEGDETYASGDGFQTKQLTFPEGFDIKAWAEQNFLPLNDFEG